MTLTIDELKEAFLDAWLKADDERIVAGIRAIVRALRDEIVPTYWKLSELSSVSAHDLRNFFNEILGDEPGPAAGEADNPSEGRSSAPAALSDDFLKHTIGREFPAGEAAGGPEVTKGREAPAADANVGQRLITAAHEAAAIARGEKEPAAVHAADVCVWTPLPRLNAFRSGCERLQFEWTTVGKQEFCPSCGKPISFKETMR